MSLNQKTRALMLHFEGCDQPGEFQGGDSGVTIGIGDDLGYTTLEHFKIRWQGRLRPEDFTRLAMSVGKKKVGQDYCNQFHDIKITMANATAVFESFNVPEAEAACRLAFFGFDQFHEDLRGALTSLAYNRGTGMNGPTRSEMRLIRDTCTDAHSTNEQKTRVISNALHSMERLWPDNTMSDGDLNDRRHAEGYLADPSCICPNRKG